MPVVTCMKMGNIRWNCIFPDTGIRQTRADLWRIAAGARSPLLDPGLGLIQADEWERAGRFHRDADRIRYLTGRAALRLLSSRYLHCSPGEIGINEGPNKKPFMLHPGQGKLEYNVAHSGDWALIGFSAFDIGVDLEKIEDHFDYQDILPVSFSLPEISMMQQSPSPRASFYLLWTRKEALIKATAKGLDGDLPGLPCLDGDHRVEIEAIGSAHSWNVKSFEPDRGYQASVAVAKEIQEIGFWDFDRFYSGL
jgi:4'-phosphopantetheinyl transferase